MDTTPDPLFVQLRKALRAGLSGLPAPSGVHGAPVTDGASGPTRAVLDALGAADFERPASVGGLGLGLTAGVLVSEELGRAARGNSYRAEAMSADLDLDLCREPDPDPVLATVLATVLGSELGAELGADRTGRAPAGIALAGLEALPAGGGVTAAPRAGGWELNGAATVDDVNAGTLLVAARTGGRAVLVTVPREAAGAGAGSGCWPPVVRFRGTPVPTADLVGPLDDSPTGALARARLRQAGYLLGIADGAHQAAVRYTGFRQQFGSRLRDLPAVSFPLAQALVALRATRAAVYRGAWSVDSEPDAVGTAPVIALAMAAETAREVVRLSMQSCGVRAMTAELGLHRYFRLAAAESARYGDPAVLWRTVGAERIRTARRELADAERPLATAARR
jgi:alkylation response protein AidB-like acyl-CoA dehydrogenase